LRKNKTLIIFAKAPVPGQVKTRLRPQYSPERAAIIHQQLLEFTVSNLCRLTDVDVQLHCAPDQSHHFFKYLCAQYKIKLNQQSDGDLGEKMSNALFNALLDYQSVILIGADVPAIDANYINTAFESLKTNPTVIAPAEDGGYVLVGLTKPQPTMFDHIEWGSHKVLQQTIDQLSPEIPILLDTLWDVDRAEDVERFNQLRAKKYPWLS